MLPRDPYWNMKMALARHVASGGNPTVSRFTQAFKEEFGEPPSTEIVQEFKKLRPGGDAKKAGESDPTVIVKIDATPAAPPLDPGEPGALPAVLDQAHQGALIVTDPEGRISAFSAGASRLLGHSRNEALGRNVAEFVHFEPELAVYARVLSDELERKVSGFSALTARVRSGRPEERDWTLVRKDGKRIAARVAYAALRDQAGGIRGFAVSATDQTQLRLTTKDLGKLRQELDSADRRQAEFLEQLSLAVRTPLNSVLGFADILSENRLDPTVADQARSIRTNARELLAVIDGLLDFSRRESGELDLIQSEFDLEGLIHGVIEGLGARLAAKPVSLSWHVDPSLPEVVTGDPDRYRQVLAGLLGNAARYTESGEIRVVAEAETSEAERVKVRVAVSDTGRGIPVDRLEAVFQPIKKAGGAPATSDEARDLSLAVARQVARLMGGDLSVTSAEGAGSTFFFSAWLGRPPDSEVKAQPPKILTGKKILVVNDSERHLESLTRILEAARMRVVALSSGIEAVPTLQRAREAENPLDAVLCGLSMNGMDGYEVARQIRLLGRNFARLPLVALAPVTGLDAKRSAEAGFDEVMTAPIRKSALYEVLARLLGRGSVVATSAGRPARALRILLAEDNPDNYKLANFILTKAGHEVDGAADGEQAVRKVLESDEGYDLILMDVEMPKMDGFSAVRAIRDDGFRDIPILALTAHALPGDRDRCIAAGMTDYISKPLKKDDLLRMVDKYGKLPD